MKELYLFWGKVIAGKKRGRALGYPTANIHLHKKIPEGIYASLTKFPLLLGEGKGEVILPSVTFIGSAKTFNERDVKAETYILDFDENIYGKWITIKLYKKLRDNKKFDSEKALIIQMKRDIGDARAFCHPTES